MKWKWNSRRENHNEINLNNNVDTTAILVNMSNDIGFIKAKVSNMEQLEKKVENLEKRVAKLEK